MAVRKPAHRVWAARHGGCAGAKAFQFRFVAYYPYMPTAPNSASGVERGPRCER